MSIILNTFKQKLKGGFFGFRIRQWRTTFLILGLIIIMGGSALIRIPKESYPEVTLGMVMVTTPYPGGSPKEIDQLITQKLEQKIKNLEGVKKLTSTSRKNVSSIMVELSDDEDTTIMTSKIRDSISPVTLPENAEDPIVTEITNNKNQLFSLLLYAKNPTMDIHYLKTKANLIKHALEGKSEIDTIEIEGGGSYDIEILLDKTKLEHLGLTLNQIAGQLQAFTSNQPLGNHKLGTMNYDFRIAGELHSEGEIRQLPILLGAGKLISLGQIASFHKVYKDKDTILHVGSKEAGTQKLAVRLIFSKKAGTSILSASKHAKQAIAEELKKPDYQELGSFYTLDLGEMISQDYDDLAVNGISTMVIVFFIVLIFVGTIESTIATLSIPLAFFITFSVLNALGLSLNFLTNFSLIICLGIAIDTATVIIQGASEYMKQGFSPINSALLSVKTYKNSLISGTATTLIVFVPMLTLPGIMGKFLSYIPTTIFITLLASLFISLTITPVLFFKFSKHKKTYEKSDYEDSLLTDEEQALLAEEREQKEALPKGKTESFRDHLFIPLIKGYDQLLHILLETKKKRITLILIPIIMLILTVVFISPRLGFLMMPAADNEYLNITLTAKEGITTQTLLEKAQTIENIVGKLPELKNYTYTIQDNIANLDLRIVPRKARKRDSFTIEHDLENQLSSLKTKDLDVEIGIKKNGPLSASEIGIKLLAEDTSHLGELSKVASDFKDFLKHIPGTKNVKTTSEESPGEFIFTLDRQKLALLNLTTRSLAPELYFALNGIKAGTFTDRRDTHNLRLKYADFSQEISPDLLMSSFFSTPNGKIALASVGNYQFSPAISKISRENGLITITVQSSLEQGIKAEGINHQLTSFAKSYHFPEGISYQQGGEKEDNADLLTAMMSAFLISLIGIFAILVLQFNSYTQPGIILYSVVMGFLGATYGMWITGNPYGMLFLIGFIALMGIVVNNAIILIDSANGNQKLGQNRTEAIRASAKSRIKPILSTTLTTVIGMITLTTDGMLAPLAWTIIFGLSIATLMTLFVIPALYEDEDTLRYIIRRFILKPLFTITIPCTARILIGAVFLMFGISLFSGAFAKPFAGALILTVLIFFFIINSKKNQKGEVSFIQKIVGLQLISTTNYPIKKRQFFKRLFIKRGILILPTLPLVILRSLGSSLGNPLIGQIGIGFALFTYLIIILGNLVSIRTSHRKQTWRDKWSNVEVKVTQ